MPLNAAGKKSCGLQARRQFLTMHENAKDVMRLDARF